MKEKKKTINQWMVQIPPIPITLVMEKEKYR
ncbi:hypothetical protein OTSGILL_2212 [Orientia tsutsugamushi str. Gilliam]|uniref:Uncharacterized protein n=1 Tax=Orientia tsutsugamushi str. Gilliam TaxID=1359184 RepID=A0A0F3M703_ORITS|nr:hypothetical protein OTSGILL_2212 [Orientia tsutsugamushi str. Gilliam]